MTVLISESVCHTSLSSLNKDRFGNMFAFSGMDVYGYLMAREGHLEDVEVLGGRLFNISDQHAEPWVISG